MVPSICMHLPASVCIYTYVQQFVCLCIHTHIVMYMLNMHVRAAPRIACVPPSPTQSHGSFRKLGVPYFGVLIIRIQLFRVLY